MKKRVLPALLFLFLATPVLRAQNDTLPLIGGIVPDDSTYATAGEPQAVTRSSIPGGRKSLLEKVGITPFTQRCELSCGSCAAAGAVMTRRKIYCDAECKCSLPIEVFSWSIFHNQLVKKYGKDNIRLKNVLDLLQEMGIPLASDFANTPCSHDRLPDNKDRDNAARFRDWIYKPVFHAKKSFPGTPQQKENQFRAQLVANTISWIDQDIPVIICLLVTESFRSVPANDCRWQPPASLEGAKGHAMLVMDYDDQVKEFKLLNSYGTGWGCEGVVRISYDDYTRVAQEGYVIEFEFDTGKKVDCSRK
jgi:hypothetical protein